MAIEPSDLMNGLGLALINNGDGTYKLRTDAAVSFNPGDVEIGAVEIKNGTDDTRAIVDSDGLHVVTMSPWVKVGSSALEASHILKATPGTLRQVFGYNSKTSDQFIQLFNSATLPADTEIPVACIRVRADSNFCIDFGEAGQAFDAGITVCNSSTSATKTIGSADVLFYSQIK